jgi:hypothetical protein
MVSLRAISVGAMIQQCKKGQEALFFNWLLPAECLVAATTTAVTAAATAATATAATASTAAVTAAAASTAAVTAATATAATASTAAVTTTTTAAAEAAATGTWRTCLHWARFVHNETTSTVLLTIHSVDSCLRFCIAGHFNKTETFRTTGVTFHHDFGAGNGTVCGKCLLQVFVTERIWQIAYVKFVAHERTPQNNSKRDGVQNRY